MCRLGVRSGRGYLVLLLRVWSGMIRECIWGVHWGVDNWWSGGALGSR